jgi:large subunit ribosomal protein L14e
MSLFSVGRLCLKIAGRDSMRKCVVAQEVDNSYVVIDGDVRRKKVNVKHLEPLAEVLEIGKGSHEDVKKAFEKVGLNVWERKSKKPANKPIKQRKAKQKPVKEPKAENKTEKKADKKENKKTDKGTDKKADTKEDSSKKPESVEKKE